MLLCAVTVLCAVSCSKLSDGELKAEYKALYEKVPEVNNIIYGTGLPHDAEVPQDAKSPYYVEVSADCPYKSVSDIEAAVLAVYTEDYYNDSLKNVLFKGIIDEIMEIKPRYVMSDEGKLMVDAAFDPYKSIVGGRCDVENAYVIKSSSRTAIIGAPYYINGERREKDKETTLILTASGWRFDNLG